MAIKPLPGRWWGIAHKLYLTVFWPMLAVGAVGLCFSVKWAITNVTCIEKPAFDESKPFESGAAPARFDELVRQGGQDQATANYCRAYERDNWWMAASCAIPAVFVFGFYRWLRWLFGPSADTARPHPAP